MQNGKECWGGNAFGKYGAAAESACDVDCAKDPTRKCGGVGYNTVYSFNKNRVLLSATGSLYGGIGDQASFTEKYTAAAKALGATPPKKIAPAAPAV
jgi:hypothetical protein